jgi:hypothetical protein
MKIPICLRPLTVILDEFDGKASGGRWIAFLDGEHEGQEHGSYVVNETQHNLKAARNFWNNPRPWWIAVGKTPKRAIRKLIRRAQLAG